jgi:hypothetical protein
MTLHSRGPLSKLDMRNLWITSTSRVVTDGDNDLVSALLKEQLGIAGFPLCGAAELELRQQLRRMFRSSLQAVARPCTRLGAAAG